MKTLHGIVSGRVQGVGFRYFVEVEASRLGLKGWVRNLRGGQVEVLATGEEASIGSFLASLRSGPPMSHVTDVEVDWNSPPSDEPFHIRTTG